MDDRHAIRLSELTDHTDWVRRLARGIVADAHGAEDVAQDACMAWLRGTPSADRPLRPWLAAVTRNLARYRRRSDRNRDARQTSYARASSETAAPADDVVEQVEMTQVVIAELLRLPEPLRETVALRYLNDLPSPEIARRTGVPEGTVRWRLKRGLDELRSRLDGRFDGDRRSWLAVLAPMCGQAPLLTIGVLSMKTALLAIAGALTVAAWLLFPRQDPSEAPPDHRTVAAAPALGTPETTAQDEPVVDRRPPEEAPSAGPSLEKAAVASVRARIVDTRGNPLLDATLAAVEHAGSTEQDPNGWRTLRLDAPLFAPTVEVEVQAPGHVSHREHVAVEVGEVVSIGEVQLVAGGTVLGRVVDEHGAPVGAGVRVAAWRPIEDDQHDDVRLDGPVDDRNLFSHLMPEVRWPSTRTGPRGDFRLDGVPAGAFSVVASADGYPHAFVPKLTIAASDILSGVDVRMVSFPPSSVISGRVVAADGGPAANATVIAAARPRAGGGTVSFGGKPGLRYVNETTTDEDGVFTIAVKDDGEHTLGVRSDDHSERAMIDGIARGGHDLRIQLDPAPRVTLRPIASDGSGIGRFELCERGPFHPRDVWTSISGDETARHLAPGTSRIAVRADGFQDAITPPASRSDRRRRGRDDAPPRDPRSGPDGWRRGGGRDGLLAALPSSPDRTAASRPRCCRSSRGWSRPRPTAPSPWA